jgi:chromosome partitioning protein
MKLGITNLKGGVGKTTISQNIAVCFAHLGYSVAVLDTDRNQNSITWSGLRESELKPIFVFGGTDAKALKKQIDHIHQSHDIVIIDGTPSLSEMTTRIILASDLLIVPILASANDLFAAKQFLERLNQAKDFRDEIPAFFLLNQYKGYNAEKSVIEVLETMELPLLETRIKERVAYSEVVPEGKGVVEWSDAKAADEMIELTGEIIKNAKELGLL